MYTWYIILLAEEKKLVNTTECIFGCCWSVQLFKILVYNKDGELRFYKVTANPTLSYRSEN